MPAPPGCTCDDFVRVVRQRNDGTSYCVLCSRRDDAAAEVRGYRTDAADADDAPAAVNLAALAARARRP